MVTQRARMETMVSVTRICVRPNELLPRSPRREHDLLWPTGSVAPPSAFQSTPCRTGRDPTFDPLAVYADDPGAVRGSSLPHYPQTSTSRVLPITTVEKHATRGLSRV